ncbi:MAG: LamG domain-containing protein, partial [bacterium]|nr:LamG domain-containing protein [bacterium]
ENSGSIASDNSVNDNIGILINGPQWTTGRSGSALIFDGNDDFIDCDNDQSLDITDEITIETWINPAVAGEGGPNAGPICKAEDGVDWSWQLRYNAPGDSNFMGFQFNTNSEGRTWVSVNQNLIPGEWYHIIGVFDGTNIVCYLNGVETDRNQISSISGGNARLFIGQDGWGNVFNGIIDDVRIWNKALSP